MTESEYQNALSDMQNALADPAKFLGSVERYDDSLDDILTYLNDSFWNKTAEEKFVAWSELVRLLPDFKRLGASEDDMASEMANRIALNTLRPLQRIVPHHSMPVERMGAVLDDLREMASFITDPSDCNFMFAGVLDEIHKRAPKLAKIPEDGHCIWFSGVSVAGNLRKEISTADLIHAAKYAHLHPKGVVSLWTDDINLVEKSKAVLSDILQGKAAEISVAESDAIHAALAGAEMTPAEAVRAIQRIHAKPWQDVFKKDWGDFPKDKKALLESVIIEEINGVGPLRFPASAKDVFLMVALAIMDGGVGFDLDIVFRKKIEIFDPFGLQCMAAELPPGGPLAFSSRPQVRAAPANSKTAIKALEKMADFLASINRFEDKRISKMDRPDFQGVFADSRYRLAMQLAEQPSHAIRALFGDGCYQRFASLNKLAELDGSAFIIPPARHKDMKPKLSALRRASDPAIMQQNTVENPPLIDVLYKEYRYYIKRHEFEKFLAAKSKPAIRAYKLLAPNNFIAQVRDEVNAYLTNAGIGIISDNVAKDLEQKVSAQQEESDARTLVETYIAGLSSPVRKVAFLLDTTGMDDDGLFAYVAQRHPNSLFALADRDSYLRIVDAHVASGNSANPFTVRNLVSAGGEIPAPAVGFCKGLGHRGTTERRLVLHHQENVNGQPADIYTVLTRRQAKSTRFGRTNLLAIFEADLNRLGRGGAPEPSARAENIPVGQDDPSLDSKLDKLQNVAGKTLKRR